jgi:hypothetical protein
MLNRYLSLLTKYYWAILPDALKIVTYCGHNHINPYTYWKPVQAKLPFNVLMIHA